MGFCASLCRWTGIFGVAGLLTACELPPVAPAETPVQPRTVQQPPRQPQAPVSAAVAPPPSPQPAAPSSAPHQPAGTLTLLPAKPVVPQNFVGLDADTLVRILGRPDFTRRDGDVEVWQYRSANCVTDMFLYPQARAEGSKDVHMIRHMEIRPRNGADTAACSLELGRRFKAG